MMEESLSSGSSRQARTPATRSSSASSCMVDGCTADLGQCRDYHRRHKVCELHSKTSIVFVKGQEQRFCQQCSRFHSLVEFDDGKRSCRKRLEEHNLRRRKPRQDSISDDNARLFSSSQGTRYIHFGAPWILSDPMISEPLARIAKSEDHTRVYDGHPSSSFGANRRSSAGFINRVVESDSALSLLSSPPVKIQEINMVRPELISSLNYSCIGLETQPDGSVLVSDSGNANLHGQNTFHVMPDGASATGSQPTLSFSWE